MSEVSTYLREVELALVSSPIIVTYDVLRLIANTDDGYIRVRAVLVNDDSLEAAEYFVVEQSEITTVDYHYQWMSPKQESLRRRWDNAPHHPELAGFPHHVHVGDEPAVASSGPMSLVGLLHVIEDEILRV